MISPAIILVLRAIFGSYMAIAGILKLPDLKGFSRIVLTYRLLPRWLAEPSSYVLPFVEIFAGLGLIVGWQLKYFAGLALLLTLTSLFFVSAVLIQGKRMESCGCLGTAIKIPINWKKLVEVLVWLVIAIIVFYFSF